MKKILLTLLMGMFLLSLTSAAIDTVIVDDVFKLNEVINYAKPCFNNGTYCSGSAVCNYTTFFPDNSIYLNNVQATNNLSNHNFSMAFTELGIYTIDMVCHDGGLMGSETFFAQITGSGFNNSTAFYMMIILISAGIIVFGFWIRDPWIVILGTFGLYFVGIYMLINGIDTIQDVVTTRAISIITLMVAAYISVKTGIEVMS